MSTLTLKHRYKDRDVKVPRGSAYSRPARRPKPRLRVGQERLGIDVAALLERSLTTRGKTLDRRTTLTALSQTRLGYSRSIVCDGDGVLSCDLPIRWPTHEAIQPMSTGHVPALNKEGTPK